MSKFVVTTFYKIVNLPNYRDLRAPLLRFCNEQKLSGTILLTPEGVNATVAGSKESINSLYTYIQSRPALADIEYKESYCEYSPFQRMKVLLKQEVVAMRAGAMDFTQRGEYVSSADWDEMITDPNIKVIDTRNDFEVEFGTFRGAINPKTTRFSEFAAWANEYFKDCDRSIPVAMFCTGGIRCEKSTAYMKKIGFHKVYHLQGGILKYLEETGNHNKMWQGSCFVFDDRLAVNDQLQSIEEEQVY